MPPQAARLLRSWVQIPPGAWIFVCCECRVLSGRGLCDELITRPEEYYRLCCVVVCDLETSRIGAPYIYDISSLRVKVVLIKVYRFNKMCVLNVKRRDEFQTCFQQTTINVHIMLKMKLLKSKYFSSWCYNKYDYHFGCC